jgi:hypothetical protein
MDSTKVPANETTQNTVIEKATEDTRAQPWKQHLEEMKKEAEEYTKTNKAGSDMFKVEEGFNDHGMSG